MPYKDPEKRRAASRESKRRVRAREAQQRAARVIADGEDRLLAEAPGADELVRLLGVQARGGSVRAIELLLKREDADVADAQSDSFASFTGDELARRRAG